MTARAPACFLCVCAKVPTQSENCGGQHDKAEHPWNCVGDVHHTYDFIQYLSQFCRFLPNDKQRIDRRS